MNPVESSIGPEFFSTSEHFCVERILRSAVQRGKVRTGLFLLRLAVITLYGDELNNLKLQWVRTRLQLSFAVFHHAFFFTRPISVFDVVTLIKVLFTFGQMELQLHPTGFPVHGRGY